MQNNWKKYKAFPKVNLKNRLWPDNSITKAPTWCSVDLRDGNQALVNPMNISEKIELFKLLKKIGFKQIEIGFPSASKTELEFARELLKQDLLTGIRPQVLVQAKENLIDKTFESIDGYKQAIIHFYNSTSKVQRDVVFKQDKKGIIDIAINACEYIKKLSKQTDTEIILQYSPESFTATELDFSLEICQKVAECWGEEMIINLPATVELHTPNIHADQIEWFINNFNSKQNHIISLHTHNDRGTGVAATELGLLAGASRVEGTLFGNGERTGNLDIINVALNLLTQGINPELDLSNIENIKNTYENCTGMLVPKRHPYAGELVFTAFSGSHQDAIKKGIEHQEKDNSTIWNVPYIPIDPKDIGRSYEAIVRINSQSGKGGVAFILKQEFGIDLPKSMHPYFGKIIQNKTEKLGRELLAKEIYDIFFKTFINNQKILTLNSFKTETNTDFICSLTLDYQFKDQNIIKESIGNGPIDACKKILVKHFNNFKINYFSEHSLSTGSDAKAIAFIEIISDNKVIWGSGINTNTAKAGVLSLFSACNNIC